MVELSFAVERFRHNAQAIAALAAGVDQEQARWKPAPDQWSILEVINHLYDEEREDFRTRLDLTLHQPETPWPAIDPQGWVASRHYNGRDLAESLAAFRREREASLAWLAGLKSPDWEIGRRHPAGFTLRAGDLLASWLAHDTLHLRQLAELHYQYHQHLAAPYDVAYAGQF
ncbi:MAG TPA: DinB family protein [Caldilineaceae bacterium]|nr:DinB family protein [Caldilineaceae bacterium]